MGSVVFLHDIVNKTCLNQNGYEIISRNHNQYEPRCWALYTPHASPPTSRLVSLEVHTRWEFHITSVCQVAWKYFTLCVFFSGSAWDDLLWQLMNRPGWIRERVSHRCMSSQPSSPYLGLLTGCSAAEMHLKQVELPCVVSSVGCCRFHWLQSECGCWQVTLPHVSITPRLLDRLQLMSVGQNRKLLSHRVNLWRGHIQSHDGEKHSSTSNVFLVFKWCYCWCCCSKFRSFCCYE